MGYPSSRKAHHGRSRLLSSDNVLLLLFIFLTVLLFKVDIYIAQSRSKARTAARHNIGTTTPPAHPILPPPKTNNEPPPPPPPMAVPNGTFDRHFEITWGDGRATILEDGELLTLSLDKLSGSGFQSRNEYLFGKIDMQLKLVAGNSAGTVTAYYLSSEGTRHDEIDFEFLGNSSGDPYTLHTNVFSQGKGMREQQFFLWFDPTADFHTYSILWNPQGIIFSVDGTPIREFKNSESIGVPFPKDQPMRIYSSLWNADDWATRGGRIKTNWTQAPFTASYRNFKADACICSAGSSSCNFNPLSSEISSKAWFKQKLDSEGVQKLRWVQKNHLIYNYCKDNNRFPQGLPPECKFS